jgi:hypothetical protein
VCVRLCLQCIVHVQLTVGQRATLLWQEEGVCVWLKPFSLKVQAPVSRRRLFALCAACSSVCQFLSPLRWDAAVGERTPAIIAAQPRAARGEERGRSQQRRRRRLEASPEAMLPSRSPLSSSSRRSRRRRWPRSWRWSRPSSRKCSPPGPPAVAQADKHGVLQGGPGARRGDHLGGPGLGARWRGQIP